MSSLAIPDREYFLDIKRILFDEILSKNKINEFNNIRRSIYGNEKILSLLSKNNIRPGQISSGVSDRKAYKGYIKQIISDFSKDKFYREYFPSRGNPEARTALSIYESYKLSTSISYSPEDFCLTEGSTGAITMIFEYFKKNYPDKEILIQSPNYYLYKFAARYYGLNLKELTPTLDNRNPFFISVNSLIFNASKDTKLIILTNPANPSGEIFTKEALRKLFLFAKRRNILILVDELFAELVFQPQEYVYSDQVASELQAMSNLVIVKGFSKSKNLVGLRIGYLYSKNQELIEGIALISQQRSSFSVGSNFTGLICLDAFIQSVRWLSLYQKNNDYKRLIKKVYRDFTPVQSITEKTYVNLTCEYEAYQKYFASLMKFYSERFDDSLTFLVKDISAKFPKISAFNTMVKIRNLEGVNSFDFMINCFFTTGLKTEIGPCFGFDQKTWDDTLGFWLRITFAQNKETFIGGLKKFVDFKKIYLGNRKKFLDSGLSF